MITYSFIPINMSMQEVCINVFELRIGDISHLNREYGFTILIQDGLAYLQFNQESYAQLIEEEIMALESEARDYIRYCQLTNKPHDLLDRISPFKTIQDVLDGVKRDWYLDDEELADMRAREIEEQNEEIALEGRLEDLANGEV